ncbi:serine/threonine-protein kinase [Naasia sp. SYSU D00057]|uniref:serine/threonine-protein kinase n=1 Tax=Naasia sp. SYSU D00057 TaxID=2817380 RepID=UPI001B30F13C|nr:serine/threonine-protein kinase [Naasia sp. SYSU D00057]
MTSTPASAASVGVLGGRYRLGEVLGHGGMAVVHRATDLQLGREVAVKLFRSDVAVATDPRRIQAEIRMLASVNHPNLVTLHDASPGSADEPAYLVMELVDGDHLGRLLPELSPHELATIGAQLAAALAHVHESGIVHRDVKPANVLVTRRGSALRAKLGDLGIARLVDGTRMTDVNTLLGTAAYLSPEQVLGNPPTPASDVYALGLLMLEGLTGEHPFPGTRGESLAARTSRPPHLPAGLSPADAALLSGMTAPDPAARLTAAAAEMGLRAWSSPGPFARPAADGDTQAAPAPTQVLPASATAALPTAVLDSTAPAAPASAAHPATEETAVESRPRRRALTVTAAVVVVLAVVLAGLFLLRPGPEQQAPAPEPTYPVVEGPLGDHLEQLQETVVPG